MARIKGSLKALWGRISQRFLLTTPYFQTEFVICTDLWKENCYQWRFERYYYVSCELPAPPDRRSPEAMCHFLPTTTNHAAWLWLGSGVISHLEMLPPPPHSLVVGGCGRHGPRKTHSSSVVGQSPEILQYHHHQPYGLAVARKRRDRLITLRYHHHHHPTT